MSDSDDRKNKQEAPAWQQAASNANATEGPNSTTPSRQSTLEVARKFLEDDEVRGANKEEKVEFLQSKGIAEADIRELLKENDQQQQQQATSPTITDARKQDLQSSSTTSERFIQQSKPDHPPIVTYPEFLTKPAKPPPLITASGLINSLGLIAGLSSFVYGATKYIVSPMVDNLTEARVDFHENTNKNLSQLVEKLEHTVSEIPVTYHTTISSSSNKNKPAEVDRDDDASSYDDPSELFHRDVGVQTSPPASPARLPYDNDSFSSGKTTSAETTDHQADQLALINLNVRKLASEITAQAEGFVETKNVLDNLSGDLHTLTYPPESFGVGSNYLYGTARSEPDDEIKRAKMNIRSVKGVLLSTRSFPATTR